MAEQELSTVEAIGKEITAQLSNASVSRALLATTFKGLDEANMRRALMEGMIRGFTFKEFLQKDVYAVPFGKSYSLVTSIDFARKIASRTDKYFGKTGPIYESDSTDGTIISCEISVKKLIGGQVGEFTSMVYFSEYDGKRNLWVSKPRTMIAKVAEMHALRMAFPEALAKIYTEEEFDKPASRMATVVDHSDESVRMGDIKKDAQGKDEATDGDGIYPEPTAEEIIQIEEQLKAESQ